MRRPVSGPQKRSIVAADEAAGDAAERARVEGAQIDDVDAHFSVREALPPDSMRRRRAPAQGEGWSYAATVP